MMKRLLFIAALFLAQGAQASYSGYADQRTWTIDHTQVPNTDQVGFVALVSTTNLSFANVANGGKVQNVNGYDLVMSSTPDCASILNWEDEAYSSTTGNLIRWVRTPVISHTTDTVIYFCYGNATISSAVQAATATWDTTYVMVSHYPGTSSVINANDSTFNANNGTTSATNTPVSSNSPAGKIGPNAPFFTANTGNGTPSEYIDYGDTASTRVSNVTASVWCYNNGTTAQSARLIARNILSNGNPFVQYGIYNPNVGLSNLSFILSTGGGGTFNFVAGTTTLTANTWYLALATYDGTTAKMYLNSVVEGSAIAGSPGSITYPNQSFLYVGGDAQNGSANETWGGSLDEARVENVARSQDWISTRWHNENSPGTFSTIGPETTSGGAVVPALFFGSEM